MYSEKWLDFVVKNRAGESVRHKHDAIFGNIANDDVAAVVNDYMRLLQKGRIEAEDSMQSFIGQAHGYVYIRPKRNCSDF